MDNDVFISLLNPAIALVLASAFLLFWIFHRQQTYLAFFAFAYSSSGAGFLLQHVTLPIGFEATKFLSNLCFMTAAISLSATVISRHGRQVPWIALALLGSGGLVAFAWFLLKEPNLTWRVYAMNFALGGISLVVAAELRRAAENRPTAKVLLALSILAGLNFLIRPLLTTGTHESYQGFHDSLYWTTAVLSHGILLLLIALTLLTAAALDLVKQYRIEAHVDPLSGILNRRGFEEAASVALKRARSNSFPVTLVIADLDHFKEVNDRYGHEAGDNVIATFSKLIATATDRGGIAGRIGGEEFAILLPAADIGAARLFAEGVRAAFSSAIVPGVPSSARLTATFGISARSGDKTLSTLLRRADEALYRAKRSGRDRVALSYQVA